VTAVLAHPAAGGTLVQRVDRLVQRARLVLHLQRRHVERHGV
jgi:hypothetical protein